MGQIHQSLPVKLLMPMFSGVPALFEMAECALMERFGPVDYRSPRLPFIHTHYYDGEFGPNLERQFLAFERLMDPAELAGIKVWTNALEERLGMPEDVAPRRPRRINLDPGYVSEGKVVLATTKDHGHRLYLGQGIYGEVTLAYRDKDWRPWPWTYPDYRSSPYLEILRTIRSIYIAQIKSYKARVMV